jgi:hypothetical protein
MDFSPTCNLADRPPLELTRRPNRLCFTSIEEELR